jgi:hypothetical protein
MRAHHVIIEPGTVVNGCTILGLHEDTHYRMICSCCKREFLGKIWHVNKRMIKSCGCLRIKIHAMMMQQAFHNYGGKKNGLRDGGIPVSQT